MVKPISELGVQAVRARLRKLRALNTLTDEQKAERTALEARDWALYREKNPPIKTPPNFIEKDEEW